MLGLRDVTVRHGSREVLRAVSVLLVGDGVVALVGPPASGKTTLLRAVAGLTELAHGSVELRGTHVLPAPESEIHAWRRRVGMSFQNDALFDALSLYENVAFPLRRAGVGEVELASRVRQRLEAVGLWEAREQAPSELSGGMRKRAGIARALVGEPEVLLFDEPTAGLDPMTSAAILDLIVAEQRLRQAPTLVVSSDVDTLLPVCARALMLAEGALIYDGAPAAMASSDLSQVARFVTGVEGDER